MLGGKVSTGFYPHTSCLFCCLSIKKVSRILLNQMNAIPEFSWIYGKHLNNSSNIHLGIGNLRCKFRGKDNLFSFLRSG